MLYVSVKNITFTYNIKIIYIPLGLYRSSPSLYTENTTTQYVTGTSNYDRGFAQKYENIAKCYR